MNHWNDCNPKPSHVHDSHGLPGPDFEVEIVQNLRILSCGIVEPDMVETNNAFRISRYVLALPVGDDWTPANDIEYPLASTNASHD
jgi:hypothetical protein